MISEENKNLGIVDFPKGLEIAKDKNLDIYCISPKNNPPICKIGDYSKIKYENKKREKANRKKSNTLKVKEIRIKGNIELHDMKIKANKAKEFLSEGFKVKVSMRLFGRQLGNKAEFLKSLDKLIEIIKLNSEVNVTMGNAKQKNNFERLLTAKK